MQMKTDQFIKQEITHQKTDAIERTEKDRKGKCHLRGKIHASVYWDNIANSKQGITNQKTDAIERTEKDRNTILEGKYMHLYIEIVKQTSNRESLNKTLIRRKGQMRASNIRWMRKLKRRNNVLMQMDKCMHLKKDTL